MAPAEAEWVTLQVRVPYETAQQARPGAHPIRFEIAREGDAELLLHEKSTFIIPR